MTDKQRLHDALAVLREFVADIEMIEPDDPVEYLDTEWGDLAVTYVNAKKVLEDWRYNRE